MTLKNIVIMLAAAGLAVTALLYLRIYTEAPPAPLPVQPAKNPYQHAVMASGVIEAVKDNIKIGSPVSGIITRVFVQVNDTVSKGDPLFEIDSRDLVGQLHLQKAAVATAEAQLKRLQDQLQRLESVRDARAVSRDEVETKMNDVAVAEAQLNQEKADVKRLLLLLSKHTVKAPQRGTVLKNDARVGEYVTASSESPVMIIGDTTQLQVRVDVDEVNAVRIRPGMHATAFLKSGHEMVIPLIFEKVEPYVIPKRSLTGVSSERVDTRVLQLIYRFDKNLPFPVYVGEQVDVFIETPDARGT